MAAPTPNVATTAPAAAGPMTRATVYCVELSRTASSMSSSETRLGTNACQVGVWKPSGDAIDEPDEHDRQWRDPVRDEQTPQHERRDHGDGLGGDEDLAPVEAVGEHARPRREDDRRKHAGERGDAKP